MVRGDADSNEAAMWCMGVCWVCVLGVCVGCGVTVTDTQGSFDAVAPVLL